VIVGHGSAVARRALVAEGTTIRRLTKAEALLEQDGDGAAKGAGHAVLTDGTTVTVPLGDLIDLDRECSRLGGELERLDGLIQGQETKLANTQFTGRAPEAIVAREREKLASWRDQADSLRRKRIQLGCAG
jgi:valyl-tRNA synthetase